MTKSRLHRKKIDEFQIKDFFVGSSNNLFLITGPCVVEDIEVCIEIIDIAKEACDKNGVNFIFKASYDKANKTIANSYRGPGWMEGLSKLELIKSKRDIPILTDVHTAEQCTPVADVVSVLQIPSLLSKQIDLITAAASTGLPVNIKKGQFTPAWEAVNVISALSKNGFEKTMITERGYVFGYSTLISDMRSLQIMSGFKKPVIFDASHSVHGNDTIITGGGLKHRDFIQPLSRSAVANGIDGLFIESHIDPDNAKSDPVGTLDVNEIDDLLTQLTNIEGAIN